MRSTSSRRTMRVLLLTLVGLTAGFVWLVRSAYGAPSTGEEVTLDGAYRLAESRQILEATLLDEDAQIVGKRCASPPIATAGVPPGGQGGEPNRCPGQVVAFHADYPRSDVATQDLIERIRASGALVRVDKQSGTAIAKLMATFVFPLLFLANLFGLIFLSRGGDSSIADIAGFGTIRRKRQRKRQVATGVTFADVGGAEVAVTELREVTEYLTDPERFQAYGAAPPKGVLLFGPPGCGKTLLARAVAGETGVPFFAISGAEFVESLVGVGAARVRDLFGQVREVAPAIVFIDEIDAVGRRRSGEGITGGEREQTLNQLLVELDGFEVTSGIVLMGATNRPDMLDAALLRPGRFDRHVTLEAPDYEGRRAILELHARTRPMTKGVDFASLARRTPGFTGADLANVINEAALLAIRQGSGTQIGMAHLSEAIIRVLHGPQRRGKLMSPAERNRLAVHESGHALLSAAVGRGAEVHRVSIVARGRGLGQSVVAEEERVLVTVSEMRASLAVAMGGIAAEQLVLAESSSTARDDIEKATALAKEMVGLYGMSPEVGRVRLLHGEDGYLGNNGASAPDSVSPKTLEAFDDEVKALIEAAERQATAVLNAHRSVLDRMAKALEEQESLEGGALEELLAGVEAGGLNDGSASAGTPGRKAASRAKRPAR